VRRAAGESHQVKSVFSIAKCLFRLCAVNESCIKKRDKRRRIRFQDIIPLWMRLLVSFSRPPGYNIYHMLWWGIKEGSLPKANLDIKLWREKVLAIFWKIGRGNFEGRTTWWGGYLLCREWRGEGLPRLKIAHIKIHYF
jgi:hypothetical protein